MEKIFCTSFEEAKVIYANGIVNHLKKAYSRAQNPLSKDYSDAQWHNILMVNLKLKNKFGEIKKSRLVFVDSAFKASVLLDLNLIKLFNIKKIIIFACLCPDLSQQVKIERNMDLLKICHEASKL